MFSGYSLLLLACCLCTGGTSEQERSSLVVYSIYSNKISMAFYQFNVTTSSYYDYEFQLQYRNVSGDNWLTEYSYTPVQSSYDVYRKIISLWDLVTNTEYAIRMVLERNGKSIWQTSTVVVRTKPVESSRHGNQAYFFSNDGDTTVHHKKGFSAAEEYCKSFGGHLASVASTSTNDFINSETYYQSGEFWIGLQFNGQDPDYCNSCTRCYLGVDTTANCPLCDTCRSEWGWIDGSPMVYQNWEVRQPDDNTRCAVFNVDAKWYDASCDSEHYFVCSKAISCPTLEAPQNGFISLATTDYGARVQYSCEEGYLRDGEEYRDCYDFGDSTWTAEATTCMEYGKALAYDNDVNEPTGASSTSTDNLAEPRSWATHEKQIAIGLFVAAIVLLLVGGAIFMVWNNRQIKALSKQMTAMEQGKQKKKSNVYMNEGFKADAASYERGRNVTGTHREEDYEEIKR